MIFHLAIPAVHLQDSIKFYEDIGARVGRRYETNAILDFYGHQVVLHKCKPEEAEQEPKMYPRHFGLVLSFEQYTLMYYKLYDDAFFKKKTRYKGEPGEHETFFLCDPSNNLIEFKWYKNPEDVFLARP